MKDARQTEKTEKRNSKGRYTPTKKGIPYQVTINNILE